MMVATALWQYKDRNYKMAVVVGMTTTVAATTMMKGEGKKR